MASSSTISVEGRELTLSNLDKVMYPDTGFTKGDVIEFYRAISPYILPHLEDRPLTMKRFPDGVGGQHFYEKDAPSFTPAWVKRFRVPRSGESSFIHYILVNNLPTLLWSANMANLEMHPFLAKAPAIDRPTMLVFDLDPGDGASLLKSCEVALMVKALLDRLQLRSFVKLSGSKGIHLHVPLNTAVTYEATQPFAKSLAQLLESEHPELIVSEMAKAKRRGKVFVDWSQNSEHKSTVAVYSLRAKSKRPSVAMPISWSELEKAFKNRDADALYFEPEAALKRLKKVGDLFAPLLKLKQTLPQAFLDLMEQPENAGKVLEAYRRKRDFTKTTEPPPSVGRSSRQGSRRLFVIQKHAASHLHYDLRLEMDGVLKSWAVPKGPPYDLNERRLAMATEDHPMDYARFEGIIPKGEYGGGTVMVWDIGTYELIDGNYWKGKLHVFFDGKKLKGEWVLVKSRDRNDKDNTWYLIKTAKAAPRLTDKQDDASALTRRSMAKIAAAKDAVWHSNRNGGQINASAVADPALDLEKLPEARAVFIEPMLAHPMSELPKASRQWLYEIKFDGYRCLTGRDARGVKLWSRRGKVLTRDFPGVAEACSKLPPQSVVDGEIVALDEQGGVSFNLLQHHRSKASAIQYYVFDLLVYRGRSLFGLPLEDRRKLLAHAIAPLDEAVRLSESFDVDPSDLVRSAKDLGLEGIVAKRRDSIYEPGKRSGAWIKYKINRSQAFVIGGYTPGNPFDALIVGCYKDADLHFVSKVRNGFVPHLRREVFKQLTPFETTTCPFANLPERKRTQWALTREEMKNCRWLKPELVAEIEFTEWTRDGHLRHASFVRLLDDTERRQVTTAQTV